MATVISQHIFLPGFFKNLIFNKNAANFFEISRKHVFTASNRNIIKNRVEKKEIKKNYQKLTVFILKL